MFHGDKAHNNDVSSFKDQSAQQKKVVVVSQKKELIMSRQNFQSYFLLEPT